MEKCACYDPGYILTLLLGPQNGRALNVWLKNELQLINQPARFGPLSEKDILWMKGGVWEDHPTIPTNQSATGNIIQPAMEDFNLDFKGQAALKIGLEQFINILKTPTRYLRLNFSKPETEADQARIHLTIRLLRAIILAIQSELLLLPNSSGSGMDQNSFWGNTMNEAHLVYNELLSKSVCKSLSEEDSALLNQVTSDLKLPGLDVAYFNYLSFKNLDKSVVLPALAIGLSLSGLPGLDDLKQSEAGSAVEQLIKARQQSPVFHPTSAQMPLALHPSVFSLMKISSDASQMALILINLSAKPTAITLKTTELGLPEEGWKDLLTGSAYFLDETQNFTLNGHQILWLIRPVAVEPDREK